MNRMQRITVVDPELVWLLGLRLMLLKKNTSLAAQGALAHRLQRRTASKIQNGR